MQGRPNSPVGTKPWSAAAEACAGPAPIPQPTTAPAGDRAPTTTPSTDGDQTSLPATGGGRATLGIAALGLLVAGLDRLRQRRTDRSPGADATRT